MSEDLNQKKLYQDFQNLYKNKEENAEGIYNMFIGNIELTEHLSKEESSGVIKIILDKSNSKIKELERDVSRALEGALIIGGLY